MKLHVLYRGSPYKRLVKQWQTYLLGLGLYAGEVDGDFGPLTYKATRSYQRAEKLYVDGVVGNQTWGAAMADGLVLVESTTAASDKRGANWPPRPKHLRPLYGAGRERVFGLIEYVSAPTARNKEAIRITNDWQKENLRRVAVPMLGRVPGAPTSGRVFVHRLAADPLVALFDSWQSAELDHLVLSWAGSWSPRFMRGSRTTLSNHAYGTAFDINVAWNGLGRRPALVGDEGSVRELVPIANDLGWYWGGHYRTRLDGMHFELVKA